MSGLQCSECSVDLTLWDGRVRAWRDGLEMSWLSRRSTDHLVCDLQKQRPVSPGGGDLLDVSHERSLLGQSCEPWVSWYPLQEDALFSFVAASLFTRPETKHNWTSFFFKKKKKYRVFQLSNQMSIWKPDSLPKISPVICIWNETKCSRWNSQLMEQKAHCVSLVCVCKMNGGVSESRFLLLILALS